jgi:hypothetical protein
MKTRTLLIGLLPLLVTLALPVHAGQRYDGDNRFEQRIDRQEQRIRHGIRTGKLTHKEANKLQKQQRNIARLEQRFERDGHLDRRERRVLENRLDNASERIARFKHNDNYRVGRDHGWRDHGWRDHGWRDQGRHEHRYRYRAPGHGGWPSYFVHDDDPRWSLRFSLGDGW